MTAAPEVPPLNDGIDAHLAERGYQRERIAAEWTVVEDTVVRWHAMDEYTCEDGDLIVVDEFGSVIHREWLDERGPTRAVADGEFLPLP